MAPSVTAGPTTDPRGHELEPMPDLSVDLAPTRPGMLVLRTPLMAAAGAMGYGVEAEGAVDVARLGAIVTRGTTLAPREGGAPPRMAESAAGLLHAIGLQNPGLDAVLHRFAPRWRSRPVPVVLSLAAASPEEFGTLAGRAEVPGVAALELDLASIDLTRGGRPLSLDAALTGRATGAARAATDLPLLVKLSPAATDLRAVARAAVEAGADALTCGGGLPALGIDRERRRPLLGGPAVLSGPALRQIALRVVADVASEVSVPVVGCGGVETLADVLDLLLAGASAVQIGTAALADPQLPVTLADELARHCRRLGLTGHRELIGSALAKGRR